MLGTRSVWALLIVTVPCPVTLLLCMGLLSPAALAGLIVSTIIQEPKMGLIVAAIYAAQLALWTWGLLWLARRLVARSSPRTITLIAAGLVVVSLTPIYFYDCMDGHGLKRCSIPGMVNGLVTDGNQCGDLWF